jgi:nucleotide-binding universal stress UspA family protein
MAKPMVVKPMVAKPMVAKPMVAKPMVVGVDGTADSLAALSTAAELAAESGAGLVVVHVRHESGVTSVGSFAANTAASMSDALDQLEAQTRQRVSTALAHQDVPWRFDVASGDPVRALIAAARDNHASAIVVGGRHHGVVGGLIVGSVAQKLVRHSPVSVLVVRDGHAHPLANWDEARSAAARAAPVGGRRLSPSGWNRKTT